MEYSEVISQRLEMFAKLCDKTEDGYYHKLGNKDIRQHRLTIYEEARAFYNGSLFKNGSPLFDRMNVSIEEDYQTKVVVVPQGSRAYDEFFLDEMNSHFATLHDLTHSGMDIDLPSEKNQGGNVNTTTFNYNGPVQNAIGQAMNSDVHQENTNIYSLDMTELFEFIEKEYDLEKVEKAKSIFQNGTISFLGAIASLTSLGIKIAPLLGF